MEKVKKIIPLALLLSYVAKAIIVGPTVQESYIIIALALVAAYFQASDNADLVNKYEKNVKDLEEKHNKLQSEFKEIQSSLNSAKLLQSVKTYGPGR